MKRLLVCVMMILCLLPAGGCAENETDPELYSGMSVEQVEAIWGSSVRSDSYIGNLRWYVKDGYTLICGFAWYSPSKDIWYNGQLNDEDNISLQYSGVESFKDSYFHFGISKKALYIYGWD